MDRAAAQDFQQLVADLLQPEPALDGLAMVRRHADPAFIAQKVGCVQQVDVQRMAFDPLAAVQQSAEHADFGSDRDAQGLLPGRDRNSSDTRPDKCRRSGP